MLKITKQKITTSSSTTAVVTSSKETTKYIAKQLATFLSTTAFHNSMIDIKDLRENPDTYKANAAKKNISGDLIDNVLKIDEQWRSFKVKIDSLRHERNKVSESINKAKKAGEDASEFLARAKNIPQEIKAVEEEQATVYEQLQSELRSIPNIIADEVPIGKDDSENVETKRFGEPVSKEVKPHQQIAEELGVADFVSAATTSGTGFYYLEGDLALLNQALIHYAINTMNERGFKYVETPVLLRGHVVQNVVDLHDQENQIYKIENEDLYLIGTSEHSLIGRFIEKTIPEDELPIKHTSYSMCFRREKGSHGLDERGLFRTHQFNKVEMIAICKPEESTKLYNDMQQIAIDIFKGLDLPIRVLQICSGDLGNLKHNQVDIEAWSPRKDGWIEVVSCSNLTSAQARALQIKVQGKTERYTPHTLNCTAIATSRALVAILENNQNEDGSITIPKTLRAYMGGKEKITKQE